MEIQIKDRKGNDLGKLNVNKNMTVKDLKRQFLKDGKKKIAVERQWFTLNDIKGVSLSDNTKKLSDYDINSGDVLYLKDLGMQISWTVVFLVEYFGPIAIFLFLYYFRNLVYGGNASSTPLTFTQKAGFFMVLGHYIKRELETLFIHRFSNDTMPFTNIFKNSAHYWVIFGVLVGYFLFHPKYTEPSYIPMNIKFILIAAFVFFELMNFLCHNELKNLRKPGTTERGIPKGFGFGLVSCANYWWETLVWLTYSVFTGCATSYLFLLFSFYQMAVWALKKHKRYREEFKDYPKNRKAIVPFVL